MKQFTTEVLQGINRDYEFEFPNNIIKEIYEEFREEKYIRLQDLMDESEWHYEQSK